MDWVVVVDDEVINLKMAGTILSKNNMRVTALKSGTELLEYVKMNRPDLILLDIKMPGLNGLETLKELNAGCRLLKEFRLSFLQLMKVRIRRCKAFNWELWILSKNPLYRRYWCFGLGI